MEAEKHCSNIHIKFSVNITFRLPGNVVKFIMHKVTAYWQIYISHF